ncbi:MAG TPA: Gfo/Idh/MocA family oxidoreductase [Ilumatobacteraceae bacterium]
MSSVRVGLVGAGFMGKIHSIAYRNVTMLFGTEVPAVDPVAVTDFDPSLAARAVRDWGWGRAVDTWQEVTAAADVDVIDICTPNDAHVEVALDAFARGKHVLCEKPLALNAADARRLCAAAAASGCVAQVGFVYRQWPAVTMARRLIDEGTIGAVRTVRAQFLLDYNGNPDVPMSWRFDSARAGSGALGDVGSHCIDLVQYLAGPITSVAARMQTFIPRRTTTTGDVVDVTVDDQTEILFDVEGGASGTILASWAAPGHKCDLGFEVIGANGSVAFTWQRSNELTFYDSADAADRQGFRTVFVGPAHPGADGIHTVAAQGLGYTDAFAIAARNTLRNLAAGTVLGGPTFVDGLRVAEVTDAVIEAATSGSKVEVARRTV